jgi:type II secretory pathway pseudopilin PulG
MLYKSAASSGMAGCCASDTQNCGWSNACVDYVKFSDGNYDANSLLNPLLRICTKATAPYCVTWTYPGDGITNYGCAATSKNTIYTIRTTASDGFSGTTSIKLRTVSGNAISSATNSPYTYTGGNTPSKKKTKAKLSIGAIIGIVIVVLGLFVVAAIVVMMLLKKKKKQKQLAQNAQIMAANQNQNQGQMNMQMQQPSAGFQGSPPPVNNVYHPPPQQQENKLGAHSTVNEYSVSPISNPATPAPAYGQPLGGQGMPQQDVRGYQMPMGGAQEVPAAGVMRPHEVDATSVPYAPPPSGYAPPPSGYEADAMRGQGVSPVPQQDVRGYQMPMGGAQEVPAAGVMRPHEVDATSVPHAPPPSSTGSGPVYEIGHGRG